MGLTHKPHRYFKYDILCHIDCQKYLYWGIYKTTLDYGEPTQLMVIYTHHRCADPYGHTHLIQ